jgi:hypothetical protein
MRARWQQRERQELKLAGYVHASWQPDPRKGIARA